MMPDILGSGYEAMTLPLGTDVEGPVVATLVRHRARCRGGGAVLYVHGYNDYFFQRHLAGFYVSRGLSFYAIDLHKYGRSLREYQTPYLCRSLRDYFPELSRAAEFIRQENGNSRLLVNGHSLGGLIVALWVNRGECPVDAVFLNSPLLAFGRLGMAGPVLGSAIRQLGRRWPKARLPGHPSSQYARSLHRDYSGIWDFNRAWKSTSAPRLRLGWLAAVYAGLREVSSGLAIDVPILVMCAQEGVRARKFSAKLTCADAVLDPERVAHVSVSLGRHVTCIRVKNGIHDLVLSESSVRQTLFHELSQWLDAYFPN